MVLDETPAILRVEEKKKLLEILGIVEELYGVELLNYHNKNWLAGDNCQRSRAVISEFQDLIRMLQEIIHSHVVKPDNKQETADL